MSYSHQLAVTLLCALALGSAHAQSASEPRGQFRYERDVTPGGTGSNRLELDAAIIARSDPLRYVASRDAEGRRWMVFAGGFADFRLYDGLNREMPYLLVHPALPQQKWAQGRILATPPKKGRSSGFEVDLGAAERVGRLRVDGLPGPFLKRFMLEGSGDRAHWVVLVNEGTLFDLPEERLRRTVVAFAAGEYRYLRLTWDDRSSARLPLPQAAAARLSLQGTPEWAPQTLKVEYERLPSEPARSRYRLRLPGDHFPMGAIEVVLRGEGPVHRQATVTESRLANGHVASHPLGGELLRRTGSGGLVAEEVRVEIEPPNEPELELVVDDGDNPPLDIEAIQIELLPLPWIYFESPDGRPLTGCFGGGKMGPPNYDLEAKRQSVTATACAAASWAGPDTIRDREPREMELPQTSPLPLHGAEIDLGAFRFSRKIPAGRPGLTVLPLDAAVLAHSTLNDIRIADPAARQVPYLLERRDEPLEAAVAAAKVRRRQDDPAGQSRYRIDLPFDSLPAFRLVLTTSARVFERHLSVTVDRRPRGPRDQPYAQTLASASWAGVDQARPAPALTLDLEAPQDGTLYLLVDEGDNSPLPLKPARILLPSYRLRFFHAAGVELTLLYGRRDLSAPRYDLALLAPRLLGARAHALVAGPESAAPAKPSVTPLQRRLFWIAIVITAVFLLTLVLRLLVKSGTTRDGGGASSDAP